MRKIVDFIKLFKNKDFSTKVYIYFANKSYGEDYDPYEKNYTYSNLNPVVIKAYYSELTPTSLVWKSYGLKEQGAIELICDKKYKDWFEKASKIVIQDDEYQVFREGTGNRSIITEYPYNIIKVILQKK